MFPWARLRPHTSISSSSHAKALGHRAPNMPDQHQHIASGGPFVRHDEIRMLQRDASPADGVALEPGLIDQPPGTITRGILKHATGATVARGCDARLYSQISS